MDRPVRTIALAAMALAWASTPSTARAGALRIVSHELDCPGRDRIEAQIQTALAGAMELQPNLVLVLESRPPSQLVLRLQNARVVTERVVDLPPSSCADLHRSVVLLIRGWLDRRWSEPPPAPESSVPEPAPSLIAEAPPDPEPPGRLRLSALAGVYLEPSFRHLGPRMAVAVERDLSHPWALGLLGSWDAPFAQRVDTSASVSVAVWAVALVGRARLVGGEDAALDLLAGPALAVLQERSTGLATVGQRNFVDGGVVAAARWRWNLWRPLAFVGAIELEVRARRETLRVEGIGNILTLSPTRLSLATGLEAAF